MEVSKVIAWNEQRYKQIKDIEKVFDVKDTTFLNISLLQEEVNELVEVLSEFGKTMDQRVNVKVLHEGLDVVFVVIGILWKHGYSTEQITKAFDILCQANDEKVKVCMNSAVKTRKNPDAVPTLDRIKEALGE